MTRRRLRARAALAVAATAALAGFAGCGGSSTTSGSSTRGQTSTSGAAAHGSGNVREFAAEWNAAVTSGDCRAFKRLAKAPSKVDCSKLSAQGRAVAEAAYGPDGVIDTSSESCDLVDYGGELKVDQCFSKMPRTVGTSPGEGKSEFDSSQFETALDGALDGLRARKCDEFFKYAYTGPGSKSAICGFVFGHHANVVIKAIEAQKGAETQPLGGNGFWQFYGMALKPNHYVTIPVVCAPGHYFNTNSCLSPEPTPAS
jgi:hypothetical protein